MDNLNHPTGFTYSLDVVPEFEGYEWKPELDENGRTIFKPQPMETKKTCPEECEYKVPACEFNSIREKCTARVRKRIEKITPAPPIMLEGFKK